jgi:thiol-disulfide isomerase/thioredoxin
MDGDEVRLSDYRGQPVVLNFWATWCAPCRKEMPQLVHAYDDYRDQGLVVIAINQQESESIIQPFVEDYGVRFPVLIDRDGDVGDEFRTNGYPETFFIDAGGIVREHFIGPFESSARGESVQGAIGQTELEMKISEILGSSAGGDGSR